MTPHSRSLGRPLTSVASWDDGQTSSSAASSGRRGRDPGGWRHGVRSACDSEGPTTVTHGQSWSLDGCGHESSGSAFALIRAVKTCPKLMVRGRVELPTFR